MQAQRAVRLVSTRLSTSIRRSVGDATGPDAAAQLIISMIGRKDREHMVVVHLSLKHQPTAVEIVAIGDLTTAVVHPREVFKSAILGNAAAIVVGHNHPSGDLSASDDDRAIARNLRLAGIILGIPVIDFIIVADERWTVVRAEV